MSAPGHPVRSMILSRLAIGLFTLFVISVLVFLAVSLLPGESVTLHITTGHTGDPADFAAANVLRTANDLKR